MDLSFLDPIFGNFSFLQPFFKHAWVTIPLFGISVFFAVYFWADKLVIYLYEKSQSKRSEVLMHMKLLGMEIDDKKVTYMLVLSSVGVGFLLFMLVWPNIIAGFILGIVAGIGGFHLVPLVFKNMYESRCSQFVEQMVDALTIMANGIKSGSNSQQAMQRVVEIMGNPIRSEFSQVLTQTQFGQSFEEALNDLGNRIPRPDVQMFVVAINILKETGGNLSETFTTIVTTIRERQKLEKKIATMTAQGIMQGIIVSCIPIILLAVFYFIDPQHIQPMFSTTLGLILLGVMFLLILIGGFVIRKIVTIKV